MESSVEEKTLRNDELTLIIESHKESNDLLQEEYSNLEEEVITAERQYESDQSNLLSKLEYATTAYQNTSNMLMNNISFKNYFDPINIEIGETYGDFIVDDYYSDDWLEYIVSFEGNIELDVILSFDSYDIPLLTLINKNGNFPLPIRFLDNDDPIIFDVQNSEIFDEVNKDELSENAYTIKTSSIDYIYTSVGSAYWITIDEYKVN